MGASGHRPPGRAATPAGVCDRRRQRTHPANKEPHLVAYRPVHVRSWVITKLPRPARGVYFDCYVLIDIFSRYILGWTVETTEEPTIAKTVIAEAIARQGVSTGQLTLHADRGTSISAREGCGAGVPRPPEVAPRREAVVDLQHHKAVRQREERLGSARVAGGEEERLPGPVLEARRELGAREGARGGEAV